MSNQQKNLLDIGAKWFFGVTFSIYSFWAVRVYNKFDEYTQKTDKNASEIIRVEQKVDLKTTFIDDAIACLQNRVGDAKHGDFITIPKSN